MEMDEDAKSQDSLMAQEREDHEYIVKKLLIVGDENPQTGSDNPSMIKT